MTRALFFASLTLFALPGAASAGEATLLPNGGFTSGLEDWPREVTARVGDLEIRFESRSFWTLYRIDYRGTRLGLDRWGSHYGSVANFPGVGFIGSGHTENEDEQVLDLQLFVDGKPVEIPEPSVACEELRLLKKSRIRDFVLNTEIRVRDNRIYEEVHLTAEKATPLNLFYHFMHPWTETATEYTAELLDGTRIEGVFDGDGGQKIDKAARWSAIYDGPSDKGVVTYVLDAPEGGDWRTRYWDVPDRYRKHYFVTFLGRTVPEGEEFRYRILTVPFEAEAAQWKAEAARVAETCKHLARGNFLPLSLDTRISARTPSKLATSHYPATMAARLYHAKHFFE